MQTIIFSDILQPGYGKNAGAYRIATELRDNGFSCQVVDFFTHYSIEEIFKIIDKFVDKNTIWVGVSNTFFFPFDRHVDKKNKKVFGVNGIDLATDYASAYPFDSGTMNEIFKYIKSKNKNVKIVIGGARTRSAQQHDALIHHVRADYYVYGFADKSIVVLTKWLLDQSNPSPEFHGYHKNLIDSDKEYDYENFNTSKIKFIKTDIVDTNEFLPIEIARGCIFKCKFCTFSLLGKKRGDYTKKKEILQQEFIYNYETFGTTNYMFMDETTNDSMEKVEFLHDVINSLPFKINWGGYSRIDLYYSNPDMASVIEQTGMIYTQFGIETLNKKTGEAIGKGMHPDKIKDLLQTLNNKWNNKVKMSSGFVIGLPHETKETVQELENYLMSSDNPLHAWNLYPLIMSEGGNNMFGQNPSKYGYTFPRTNIWKNEHMSFLQALKMVDEIRQTTENRCGIVNWNNMRLQNLGLSRELVDKMTIRSYIDESDEIHLKLQIKKENYFKSLMQ
jgi:hypothetical protein